MNYKIEVMPGEPIILVTLLEHYSFAVDDPVANSEVEAILDKSNEPMFMMIDAIQLSLSFEDMLQAANKDTHGEQAIYRHPKLRGILIVSRSDMVRLGVKGLTTVTFGSLNAKAFKSVDEALADARLQLAS